MKKKNDTSHISQIPDYLKQGDVSIARRQRESIAFDQINI